MAIYITETDAPRPYASSPRAVLFVDAAGNTVASWTPGDIDDHGTANLPDLGVFPLTLQATRSELAALDYVLTDEFPLDHPQDCLYCASGESSTHTYEPPADVVGDPTPPARIGLRLLLSEDKQAWAAAADALEVHTTNEGMEYAYSPALGIFAACHEDVGLVTYYRATPAQWQHLLTL